MKTSDRSQNADRRILIKLMKPVAALFGCLALFVPGKLQAEGTIEKNAGKAQEKIGEVKKIFRK